MTLNTVFEPLTEYMADESRHRRHLTTFDRLDSMGDEALKARGLSRSDAPSGAFASNSLRRRLA